MGAQPRRGGAGVSVESSPRRHHQARRRYLIQRGVALYEFHDRDGAERLFQEALALARRANDARGTSLALGELGLISWEFDRDRDAALRYYDEAIALAAAIPVLKTTWLQNCGNVSRDTGEYDEALRRYREALALERASGQQDHVAILLKNMGQVLAAQGHAHEAEKLLAEAMSLDRSSVD